jgi:hypothetical protein
MVLRLESPACGRPTFKYANGASKKQKMMKTRKETHAQSVAIADVRERPAIKNGMFLLLNRMKVACCR